MSRREEERTRGIARGAPATLLMLASACGPPKAEPYAFQCPPAICDVRLAPPPPPPPCLEYGTSDPEAVDVALAELVANPEPWMGRRVRVRAWIDFTLERGGLVDLPSGALALYGFDPERSWSGVSLYRACHRRLVTVEGSVGRVHTRGGDRVIIRSIARLVGENRRPVNAIPPK